MARTISGVSFSHNLIRKKYILVSQRENPSSCGTRYRASVDEFPIWVTSQNLFSDLVDIYHKSDEATADPESMFSVRLDV